LAIWREWLHETIDPEPMPKTTMIYDSDDDLPPSKN
ncbi:AI-2E family transporter, partial [Acinetobacter baumannii]